MTRVSGMTGFGRASGEAEWGSWTWELKSVNGRGLDVRLTVPTGFEALIPAAKKLTSAEFTRGNMQIGLRIDLAESDTDAINTTLLGALAAEYKTRTGKTPEGEPLATLMTVRGVIEGGKNSGETLRKLGEDKAIEGTLLESFKSGLAQLKESRLEEGASLQEILVSALDGMTAETATAELAAEDQPAALKERLETRLAELNTEGAVDADRLAAEVAIVAAKADVREELDRLQAHIETGRGLLASGEAVGRKLDFLAQELNREANTLCSKSTSLPLTNAGLALKTLIDQFKEQAANVE